MQQILQDINTGETRLTEAPVPQVRSGQLLIRTQCSLISAGTERMLVDFGRASLIDKARQQPDKVRLVLDKVRTDGLAATVEAVRSKLDQPLPLGYCNAGIVAECGGGIVDFKIGDRVVSNGPHATVVCVSRNLCARIPDNVSDEAAAFTVLGAIGLQGMRLAQPTLGETVVVTGLGLIGLMTVQMLRANGCRVIGIDFDPKRLDLARQFGADIVNPEVGEDPVLAAMAHTNGRGVDAVIITASTESNEPVSQAAKMCRQRGRIVLVGVTGLELSRADFYKKELSFQVSCSYGPGRYDPEYENKGHDYPLGFVRWTQGRNFEAVLSLISTGALDVGSLISHRFQLQDAAKAYELLRSDDPSLGIVLQYPELAQEELARRSVPIRARTNATGKARVAFIGAGNYASRMLIPAFKNAGATLHSVVSSGGVSAVHHGRKHGFSVASTDAAAAIAENGVDTVVVATRHDSHAGYVLQALRAGKHVFCEKPLCLTLEELAQIEMEARARPGQALMVGFNRRFAPQMQHMVGLLATMREPKNFVVTVNAGAIPPDHWTQDLSVGGGRIVGEGCHFIDLLRHLAGAPVSRWHAVTLGRHRSLPVAADNVTMTLEFADESIGSIHYFANGEKGFPKERIEVFCAGRVLQLDNFRRMRGWGWNGFSRMNLWRQDKGQLACVRAFIDAIRQGRPSPIPVDEVIEVSRLSIEIQRALK